MGRPRIEIPADFAALAAKKSDRALAQRYGVHRRLVVKWRRELGLGETPCSKTVPPPESWARVAPAMTKHALAYHYGRGERTIERWARETGVPWRAQTWFRDSSSKVNVARPHLDMSEAGRAADYLRRFGPVVRCNAAGEFDAHGMHWRRNLTVLTADEVIDRAKRLGWDAGAWARIAA